jgi:hypothetical protein
MYEIFLRLTVGQDAQEGFSWIVFQVHLVVQKELYQYFNKA